MGPGLFKARAIGHAQCWGKAASPAPPSRFSHWLLHAGTQDSKRGKNSLVCLGKKGSLWRGGPGT